MQTFCGAEKEMISPHFGSLYTISAFQFTGCFDGNIPGNAFELLISKVRPLDDEPWEHVYDDTTPSNNMVSCVCLQDYSLLIGR